MYPPHPPQLRTTSLFSRSVRLSKALLLTLYCAPCNLAGSLLGFSIIMLSRSAAAKLFQLCQTLCSPMDCSLPGFSIHGILQARALEWGAITFSNAWKWKVKVKLLSRVWLLATPWTAAYQAPPSTGFSGQQYWSAVPLPSPYSLIGFPFLLVSWLFLHVF